MKLLRLIHSIDPARGGVVSHLRDSCKTLQERGHTLTVASLDPLHSPHARPWKDLCPLLCLGGDRLTHYGYSPRLRDYLDQNSSAFDAVIIEGLWQYHGYAAWQVLHQTDTPYFVFPHGMLDPWFNEAYPLKQLKKQLYWNTCEYWVLQGATGVFFTSTEEARRAYRSFHPWPELAGRIAPLGLCGPSENTLREQTENVLRRHPELRGKRLLLYLGRLHPKKGIELLLEAWSRTVHRGANSTDDAHLVIAGPPCSSEYGSYLRIRARGLLKEREKTLTWIDMVPPELKWGYFAAADMSILPSHQENFGLVVAESLAASTPVLITYAVNIWETVVQAHAGYVAPDTVEGVSQLVERWLSTDPLERGALRHQAWRCFRDQLTIQATTETLENALKSCLL